jgi:hypothetical protein
MLNDDITKLILGFLFSGVAEGKGAAVSLVLAEDEDNDTGDERGLSELQPATNNKRIDKINMSLSFIFHLNDSPSVGGVAVYMYEHSLLQKSYSGDMWKIILDCLFASALGLFFNVKGKS